jgi:putative membrane protein insertion efficiency factor
MKEVAVLGNGPSPSPASQRGTGTLSSWSTVPSTIVLLAIRAYQIVISPWLPRSCRFAPSCSAYAFEAIERKGLGSGLALAWRRLLRCHPWNGGGYDPVP